VRLLPVGEEPARVESRKPCQTGHGSALLLDVRDIGGECAVRGVQGLQLREPPQQGRGGRDDLGVRQDRPREIALGGVQMRRALSAHSPQTAILSAFTLAASWASTSLVVTAMKRLRSLGSARWPALADCTALKTAAALTRTNKAGTRRKRLRTHE
jgi:hypothetical protein